MGIMIDRNLPREVLILFLVALALLTGCQRGTTDTEIHLRRLAKRDAHRKAQRLKGLREELKWYRKAAEQGSVWGQYKLGWMYYRGEGVAEDYREAVKWYRKAAEQGWPEAQVSLGAMYAKGEGVAEDYREAVKWHSKAAEQGSAGGQFNLGLAYAYGKGVPQDYGEAVKWCRKGC